MAKSHATQAKISLLKKLPAAYAQGLCASVRKFFAACQENIYRTVRNILCVQSETFCVYSQKHSACTVRNIPTVLAERSPQIARISRLVTIFALLFCVCGVTRAWGQTIYTYTWTGNGGDNRWDNPANWSNGIPQGFYSKLEFNDSVTVIFPYNNFPSWGMEFEIKSGETVTINSSTGSSVINFTDLSLNYGVKISGGTLNLNNVNVSSGIPIEVENGATLETNGTINVGTLTNKGTLTLNTGSSLSIGNNWTNNGTVNVNGNVNATFPSDSSKVSENGKWVYNNNSDIIAGIDYNDIEINGSASTTTDLNIKGTFIVKSGDTYNMGSSSITAKKIIVEQVGTLDAGTGNITADEIENKGTIRLHGTQDVSVPAGSITNDTDSTVEFYGNTGSTAVSVSKMGATFHNLSVKTDAGETKTINFPSGDTAVNGNMMLTGANDNSRITVTGAISNIKLSPSNTGKGEWLNINYTLVSINNGSTTYTYDVTTNCFDGTGASAYNNQKGWLFPSPPYTSDIYFWVGGGGDNNWNTAANWQYDSITGPPSIDYPGAKPNAEVHITTAGTVTLNATPLYQIASMEIANGVTVEIAADITSSSITNNGTVNFTGATPTINITSGTNNGTVTINGNPSGNVGVTNSANSTVNYTISATGVSQADVNFGTTYGNLVCEPNAGGKTLNFDQDIIVNGNLTLNGTNGNLLSINGNNTNITLARANQSGSYLKINYANVSINSTGFTPYYSVGKTSTDGSGAMPMGNMRGWLFEVQDDYYWYGPSGGNWSEPANWRFSDSQSSPAPTSPFYPGNASSNPPTTGAKVHITPTAANTVTLNTTASVYSIEMNNNATLAIGANNLTVQSTWSNSGTVTVTSGNATLPAGSIDSGTWTYTAVRTGLVDLTYNNLNINGNITQTRDIVANGNVEIAYNCVLIVESGFKSANLYVRGRFEDCANSNVEITDTLHTFHDDNRTNWGTVRVYSHQIKAKNIINEKTIYLFTAGNSGTIEILTDNFNNKFSRNDYWGNRCGEIVTSTSNQGRTSLPVKIVGYDGTSPATVENTGLMKFDNGLTVVGTLSNNVEPSGTSGSITIGSGIYSISGRFTNQATVNVAATASLSVNGDFAHNGGTFTNNGTLTLNGTVSSTAKVSNGSDSTVTLGGTATVDVAKVSDTFQNLTCSTGGKTLNLDSNISVNGKMTLTGTNANHLKIDGTNGTNIVITANAGSGSWLDINYNNVSINANAGFSPSYDVTQNCFDNNGNPQYGLQKGWKFRDSNVYYWVGGDGNWDDFSNHWRYFSPTGGIASEYPGANPNAEVHIEPTSAAAVTLNVTSLANSLSNLTIGTNGTLALGANSLTVRNRWANTGTVTIASGNATLPTGTTDNGTWTYTETRTGIVPITYNTLNLRGGTASTTITATAAVTANIVNINSDTTLALGANSLAVRGVASNSWTNSGTVTVTSGNATLPAGTIDSGTWTYNNTASRNLISNITYNTLNLSGTGTIAAVADVSATNTITIESNTTFDLSYRNISATNGITNEGTVRLYGTQAVTGNVTNDTNSTVEYYGAVTGDVSKFGNSYYNLKCDLTGTNASKTLAFPATTTTVNGNLILKGVNDNTPLTIASSSGTATINVATSQAGNTGEYLRIDRANVKIGGQTFGNPACSYYARNSYDTDETTDAALESVRNGWKIDIPIQLTNMLLSVAPLGGNTVYVRAAQGTMDGLSGVPSGLLANMLKRFFKIYNNTAASGITVTNASLVRNGSKVAWIRLSLSGLGSITVSDLQNYYVRTYTNAPSAGSTEGFHPISDFAVGAVNPLFAYDNRYADSDANWQTSAFSSGVAVRNWEAGQGSDGSLLAKKDIVMSVHLAGGSGNNMGNPVLYLSNNPSSGSQSGKYNGDTNSSWRVWLPDVAGLTELAGNANGNAIDSSSGNITVSGSGTNPVFNIPAGSNGIYGNWKDGDQVTFMFGLTNVGNTPINVGGATFGGQTVQSHPLYALRLREPGDINSLDLWSVRLRGMTAHRGGVSIRNNVINVTTGEQVTVEVDMSTSGTLNVMVMTLDGSIVKYLQHGTASEGKHAYHWGGLTNSGSPVARGLYFIRVVGSGIDETRKVMVVK